MAEIGKKHSPNSSQNKKKRFSVWVTGYLVFDRRWIRFCPLPFVFLFLFFTLLCSERDREGVFYPFLNAKQALSPFCWKEWGSQTDIHHNNQASSSTHTHAARSRIEGMTEEVMQKHREQLQNFNNNQAPRPLEPPAMEEDLVWDKQNWYGNLFLNFVLKKKRLTYF